MGRRLLLPNRFLRSAQGATPATRAVVQRFHRWMREGAFSLSELQPHHIESFLQRPYRGSCTTSKQRRHYHRELWRYLCWLRTKQELRFDPIVIGPPADALPPLAECAIEAQPALRRAVFAFHRWLKDTHQALGQLTPADLEAFWSHLPKTRRSQLSPNVWRYLEGLHEQKLLDFDPRDLPGRRPRSPRCALVEEHLASVAPVLKRSTVGGRRSILRAFHAYLDRERVALSALGRPHIVAWLGWMHRRGLHASTRLHAILDVRSYLRWLEENGHLSSPADALIRSGDFPKLPQYLPRPLNPQVDRDLQRRLRKSPCPLHRGLLLMRRTGLRIGELIRLTYDCVRTDPTGNSFLKVPLGKLDNERLIPLDPRTARVVSWLRHHGRRTRPLLLESPRHTAVSYGAMRAALDQVTRGLPEPERITTHRLRHTYATSLLAGGMNLVAVMKLLGHRDYRMTLRYTAITDETVVTEYNAALARQEQRYDALIKPSPTTGEPDARKMLGDIVRLLQKRATGCPNEALKIRALIKRVKRVNAELEGTCARP